MIWWMENADTATLQSRECFLLAPPLRLSDLPAMKKDNPRAVLFVCVTRRELGSANLPSYRCVCADRRDGCLSAGPVRDSVCSHLPADYWRRCSSSPSPFPPRQYPTLRCPYSDLTGSHGRQGRWELSLG